MRALGLLISVTLLALFPIIAKTQTVTSSGTGFFVDPSGTLVTNRHVVEGCLDVRINGLIPESPAILDESSDLAVLTLQTDAANNFLMLRSGPARLAEPIIVAGYPLSNFLSESVKVTNGIVNSLAGIGNDARYLQISAPIQPGNSGGPVLGRAGDVIGVATSTLSDAAYEGAQNVNFAINSMEVVRFLTASGVPFSVSSIDDAPLDPVEMIAGITGSVAYITCHSVVSAPTSSQQTDTNSLTMWPGYDVLGFDYRTVRDTSYQACADICNADQRCRAITFNGRHQICFLKSDALLLIRNSDALGAVVSTIRDQLIVSELTVSTNTDSPGGDFLRIRDSNFVGCTLECVLEQRCVAFSFVRNTGDCWLKDAIGSIRQTPGVEFGRF